LLLRLAAVKPKKQSKPITPADLLALAEAAPKINRPRDFLPAVDKLRVKGYSWRACATWLAENAGIEIHHTHLMRLSENREQIDREGD
jgi:hypothetical protein